MGRGKGGRGRSRGHQRTDVLGRNVLLNPLTGRRLNRPSSARISITEQGRIATLFPEKKTYVKAPRSPRQEFSQRAPAVLRKKFKVPESTRVEVTDPEDLRRRI